MGNGPGILGGIGKFSDVAAKAVKANNVKKISLKLKVKKDPQAPQQQQEDAK